jgi:hypothetical protein
MVNPPQRSHSGISSLPLECSEGGAVLRVVWSSRLLLADLDRHMLTDKGDDRFDI